MDNFFETDRLTLRKFTTADADLDFLIQLLNSPGWLQFIGERNVKNAEQAAGYLEKGPFLSYRENGFGLAMVKKKEGNVPIGMCGILWRKNLEHPDIGFAFLPEYQGHGYAFEIASATVAYAKNTLGIKTIAAIAKPDNIRSVKLLEKIGFQLMGKTSSPESKEELLLFTL